MEKNTHNFILNLVHRPELSPEYAQKVNGHGKKESEDGKLINESFEIFKLQQEIAHKNGIKTTIQMTYASLFNEEAVEIAKEHNRIYGDEIALSLLGLPCKEFKEKYKTEDFCIWMFSLEDKKNIVDDLFSKFYEKFGFYPFSTGSYYMDAELINYIKQKYPSVICAIATCWEEGPKAYRTCNNSWYTLFDGGPWNPWIPSKQNTHAPALNSDEDSGIVAIPHLSRDLLACFDGNGSNFGTHPQNVLRGMIYEGESFPYLYNIIDQYRHLAKYNDGEAYNMMFVGPGWMNKKGRWEVPYELSLKSYEDCLAYYGLLKKEGKLIDMTMREYAGHYRSVKSYTVPECALWQDILYGSKKQYFWYCDPFMRLCADINQGGALIDFRPYAAKIERPVGIGTKHVHDASYPYLIQGMYRAGYFTHYAGEGTIKSLKVSYKGEEADLCLCRTRADVEKLKDENGVNVVRVVLNPVEIILVGVSAQIQTIYEFKEGSGEIKTIRKVLSMSEDVEFEYNEYMTASYGTTEYPEDMTGIELNLEGEDESEKIDYAYRSRYASLNSAKKVSAKIGAINTLVSLIPCGEMQGYIKEGYAFSPMFTLGLKKNMTVKEEMISWLKPEKAN